MPPILLRLESTDTVLDVSYIPGNRARVWVGSDSEGHLVAALIRSVVAVEATGAAALEKVLEPHAGVAIDDESAATLSATLNRFVADGPVDALAEDRSTVERIRLELERTGAISARHAAQLLMILDTVAPPSPATILERGSHGH